MADVVHQRERFDQILVQAQRAADRASDRSCFERMCQPRPMIIAQVVAREYLSLLTQPAKGSAVQDTIPIALERSADGVRRFRPRAAAVIHAKRGIRSEQQSLALGDSHFRRHAMQENQEYVPAI